MAAGQRLGDAFYGAYNEVLQLLHQVNTAVAPPPEPDQRNKSLGRAVQATVLSMLLVTALFIYLTVRHDLAWWISLIVIVSLLVISVGACLWGSSSRSGRSSRCCTSAAPRSTGSRWTGKTCAPRCAMSVGSLRRTANSSLGTGPRRLSRGAAGQNRARVGGHAADDVGMPMSTGLGSARPSHPDVDESVSYLRLDLFRPGWLTPSWDHLILSSIPPRLGSREAGAEASPVWLDHGRTPVPHWIGGPPTCSAA